MVEKLNALPLQGKLLVVVGVLAGLFGLFWFVMIDDLETSKNQAQNKVKQAEKELKGLEKYGDKELIEQLASQQKKLEDTLEANKKMLPPEEQMPDLIESLARQADERTLIVKKTEKLEPEFDDYVKRIPVRMKVLGSFPNVASFLGALAQPGQRLMTVTDIDIQAIPLKEFVPKGTLQGSTRNRRIEGPNAEALEARMAIQELLQKLDAYDNAVKRSMVEAEFTINAFSYTGELVDPAEKAKRKKRRRRRR